MNTNTNPDTRTNISTNNPRTAIKYDFVAKFTKVTNLLPWLETDMRKWRFYPTKEWLEFMKEDYSKDREVSLYLLYRYEGSKLICKIKCPINPLPVKGEFEAASLYAIKGFLAEHGWKEREVLNFHFFEEKK